jgi:hypothetical protein
MQKGGIQLNSVQTMYYVSPCCFLCLCIPFTIIEGPKLLRGPAIITDPLLLLANAASAFCLNIAVYMLIGSTSALTLNVAGAGHPRKLCHCDALHLSSPFQRGCHHWLRRPSFPILHSLETLRS